MEICRLREVLRCFSEETSANPNLRIIDAAGMALDTAYVTVGDQGKENVSDQEKTALALDVLNHVKAAINRYIFDLGSPKEMTRIP